MVGPIVMVESISWDDGGSLGLAFKDSRGAVRAVCLLDNLAGEHNLVFGDFSGSDRTGKGKMPIGGPDERTFLGLLERWCRQDPDAIEWNNRMERARWYRGYPVRRGRETEEQLAKGSAVNIMRKLRERN